MIFMSSEKGGGEDYVLLFVWIKFFFPIHFSGCFAAPGQWQKSPGPPEPQRLSSQVQQRSGNSTQSRSVQVVEQPGPQEQRESEQRRVESWGVQRRGRRLKWLGFLHFVCGWQVLTTVYTHPGWVFNAAHSNSLTRIGICFFKWKPNFMAFFTSKIISSVNVIDEILLCQHYVFTW